MSFYLQVGDCVIADGTGDATGYQTTGHPYFPEPDPDGYDGHLPRCGSSPSTARGLPPPPLTTTPPCCAATP